MGAAGRGDGDVETRRRFAAPPKFRIFFPCGRSFCCCGFRFWGLGFGFCIFFLSRYYFFLLAFAYGNGDREGGMAGGG